MLIALACSERDVANSAVQDVAAECKVRAMPTFQVYIQGQKVEEVIYNQQYT